MRKVSKQSAAREILVGLGTTDISRARQEAIRRGLSISDSTFYKAIRLAGLRGNPTSSGQSAEKPLEGTLSTFEDSLKSVPEPEEEYILKPEERYEPEWRRGWIAGGQAAEEVWRLSAKKAAEEDKRIRDLMSGSGSSHIKSPAIKKKRAIYRDGWRQGYDRVRAEPSLAWDGTLDRMARQDRRLDRVLGGR